ncbi:hypothetical protein B0H17DRAFT_1175764 [Mycena rosella]|uniref:Uncharacterized protein n=1 Tax=Mycena rosella TaxID=1033263 RepID=A0AAD7E228_MYCRO|nr:hypothetical protein B0H17DRAFT_1175764 [Mycena rosella]
MPKFTKTVTSLNSSQLLSAAADFGLTVPARPKLAQLKALVKAHTSTHPELMQDPDYAPLFTKRVRDTYFARASLTPSERSWYGIDASSPSCSASRSASRSSSNSGTQTPVAPDHDATGTELDRATQLHMLQSLNPADLDKAINAVFNTPARVRSPDPAPIQEPVNPAYAALAAQKRPERQLGLVASNAASLIPDVIRKRFAAGWKQHVPAHFLIDSFCSHNNTAAGKELDDLYTLDGSRGSSPGSPNSPSLSKSGSKRGAAYSN